MDNRKYKRIFTIVIDSLGVGALEDAEKYGDKGADTLGHISQNVSILCIPNLFLYILHLNFSLQSSYFILSRIPNICSPRNA